MVLRKEAAPPTRAGLWFVVTAALLVLALAELWHYVAGSAPGMLGYDMNLYVERTRAWLSGEPFYPAWQFAPYTIGDGAILYPPSAIPLFAAFTVLPAFLFWAIPLGIVGAVVVYHRPVPWTWPLMALCLAFMPTTIKLALGNPVMWAAAAVALGTVYGWPSVLVLIKPSLAPFALIGIRTRRWWIALAAFVLASIPFGALWLDYAKVLLNSSNPGGPLYSALDAPLVMIPIIAWYGSRRGPHLHHGRTIDRIGEDTRG